MITLYKNICVTFHADNHTYTTLEGKLLKGVTSLMREHFLAPDYTGIDKEILQEAASRGTDIHRAIEAYIKQEDNIQFYEETGFILQRFKELSVGRNWLASEYLVSDNDHIATLIDLVEEVGENEVVLWEIKNTHSVHYDAVAWQLAIGGWLFCQQNPAITVVGYKVLHTKGVFAVRDIAVHSREDVESLLSADKAGEIYLPTANALPENLTDIASVLAVKVRELAALKSRIKALDEALNESKAHILRYMASKSLKTWEFSDVKFTLVAPSSYIKRDVDVDKLAELYPDAYADCVALREVQVSASLRMKEINNK